MIPALKPILDVHDNRNIFSNSLLNLVRLVFVKNSKF